MKKIAILDTSTMSYNKGDEIIMESVVKHLDNILKSSFTVKFPTHSPLTHIYQSSFLSPRSKNFLKSFSDFDYKFVCGTNLLSKDMLKIKTQWNVNLLDSKYFNECITVGVGTDNLNVKANWYTKKLYSKVLSSKYIHSVRDSKTQKFIESLGFKAINTGCATLWGLNPKHCRTIPEKKSNTVVFTLTDYLKDPPTDALFINILCKLYEKVYFWPQGIDDYNYFYTVFTSHLSKVIVLAPSLKCYNDFLEHQDCDYVGTRVHAGIKAMQKKKRSFIVVVDNRAEDMQEYNLNLLSRKTITEIDEIILRPIETRINIEQSKIINFINQFIEANNFELQVTGS